MTYKTRQEVLRAAADWMDVCDMNGIDARCRVAEATVKLKNVIFDESWEDYEFPLALLEGKEVWVGSELYDKEDGTKIFAHIGIIMNWTIDRYSWNPPKPKTVMVELPLTTVEWYAANKYSDAYQPYFVSKACKKALENL